MSHIDEAIIILQRFGLPKAQQNERTALCLLALVKLTQDLPWKAIESPLMGITPIIEFAKKEYGIEYAPNTRESIRRQSMHQLVDAGIALINPDDPKRATNSPKNVYCIEKSALELLKTYGSPEWEKSLRNYLKSTKTLSEKYAMERTMNQIPVKIAEGKEIKLSPGDHSLLIKAIIEEFAPRFIPGAQLIYAGDTGNKWGYFDDQLLAKLGITVDAHGKMPDVVIYFPEKNWLLLVESVTSHGPVDGKRHAELVFLFKDSVAPLVFVTAFPSRSIMALYVSSIAWETEVWCADSPTHLIHFNGIRFLGPYTIKDS